jgi:hypothetical protein
MIGMVGEAVVRSMQQAGTEPLTIECGGPRVYSYQELLGTIASAANVKPILFARKLDNPAGRREFAQAFRNLRLRICADERWLKGWPAGME